MSFGRPELIEPNEIPKSFLHESFEVERVFHSENPSTLPLYRLPPGWVAASGKKVFGAWEHNPSYNGIKRGPGERSGPLKYLGFNLRKAFNKPYCIDRIIWTIL